MYVFSDFVRVSAVLIALSGCDIAFADEPWIDEIRIGASRSIQSDHLYESGIFTSTTVFIDPFGNNDAQGALENILHPRLHTGVIYSLDGNANQLYAGFDWQAHIGSRFFLNAGIGGSVHSGDLKFDGTNGPKLGTRLLFHEFLAAGVDINNHWRVLGTIEHSSNANIANANDGLSYAGISIGYKF
ncbi:MAG: hypothetical protein RLZZ444_1728 [Pseudomonadota bacterium]|jgi:hypothetical protein